MKKHLRWIIPLFVVLTVILAVGILTSVIGSQIEDTNGADTSLCTLTDEDIFSNRRSSSSIGLVFSQTNQRYTYQVKKLSGVYEAVTFRAKGETLTLRVSTTLIQGNLRIVLMCDDEYVRDIPLGKNQTIAIPNPDGKYTILLAAESAELSLECSYNVF